MLVSCHDMLYAHKHTHTKLHAYRCHMDMNVSIHTYGKKRNEPQHHLLQKAFIQQPRVTKLLQLCEILHKENRQDSTGDLTLWGHIACA